MATLDIADDTVTVHLSGWERVGAVHGDIELRRSSIASVRTTERPFTELRGVRAPGTGFPGVVALGTWRHRHGKDFVAVRRRDDAAVVIELRSGPWSRVVVGIAADDDVLDRLTVDAG